MNPKPRTKNKSNGSNRFLLCCMPQELDINMKDAVSVKQGVVLPRVLPAAAVAAAAAASLCGDDDEKNFNMKEKTDLQIMKKKKKKKKNKGNHQRLLGILKAIFFESSVARKIRKRKNKQKKRQTNGNENSMHKELSEVDDDNNNNNNNGTINVSNTSASCSSKSSSDTNKLIERKQKGSVVQSQRQHGKGCYGPNVGLCFILISLLILIIWGKPCAIFCTSTWLLFGACRRINSSSSAVDNRRHDSEEYKKKIIMEGLLERDHSRRL